MMFKGGLLAGPVRAWLLLAALLCLVWMTYSPALNFQLLAWDDDINLHANPHLTGLSVASIKWMFTDFTYQWRYQPLAWLTWFGIFEAQGLNPFGYHLANLLFHLANTALVFLLGRRLLGGIKHGETAALLGAALWSLHPMRVEVVVWAVELLYQQALFFLLASCLAYLKAAGVTGRAHRQWLAISAVAFGLSLFTFPIALGFVAVLVAMDVYLFARLPENPREWFGAAFRRVWLEKIPYIVLTLLAAVLNFICRANATRLFSAPASLEEFGLVPRIMQAFYMWAYYLWRPFWPTDLTPVPTTLIDFEPFAGVFLASLAAVVVIGILLFRHRQALPKIWLMWLAHLSLLVPVLGLTEHPHFANDRYSVVVWIGWSMLLAAGWAAWRESVRWRMVPVSTALSLVVLLAVLSVRQLPFWANNFSFFPHVIAQLKDHPFQVALWGRLGNVHRAARLRSEAEICYLRALKIQPDGSALRLTLADMQMVGGKRLEARENYRQILMNSPKMPGIHARIAKMYLDEGNYPAAANSLAEELAIVPGNALLELQYGLALARGGNVEAAANQFARMEEQQKLRSEDVFKCQLALADGHALNGDLLTATEIAGDVKQRAEAAGFPAAQREAASRLKRWIPEVLKNAPKN